MKKEPKDKKTSQKKLKNNRIMKDNSLKRLVSVMERLRGVRGCPWDKEQTLRSLIPFIVEESYEVAGAIESDSWEAIKEELGDLLFQIIFVSQIAKENNAFDMDNVISACEEKMIRRHPHVFGELKAETTKDVLKHWAKIKKAEGKEEKGYLSDITEAYPALLRAHKISEKASKVGFDWKDAAHVLEKLDEEIREFKDAVKKGNPCKIEEEIGDLLFTAANLSRFVQINPEEALRKTIGKFVNRFHFVEKKLEEEGKELKDAGLDEMEKFWNMAKDKEKKENDKGD